MLTFIILALILAIVLFIVSTVCAVLLDPIICIILIYALYKLVRLCMGKTKKK